MFVPFMRSHLLIPEHCHSLSLVLDFEVLHSSATASQGAAAPGQVLPAAAPGEEETEGRKQWKEREEEEEEEGEGGQA